MTTLTIPSIHMNGTSGDDLMLQNLVAQQAIEDAINHLRRAGPNARDFYVQGPDAFVKAQDEHLARLTRLSDVSFEIEQVAMAISEQITARSRRA